MKIFITGGSGLFGSKLAEIAMSKGYEVFSGYRNNVPPHGEPVRYDLLDYGSIERVIEDIRPDAIVHSAALTNVDRCEEEPTLAFRMNSLATKKISEMARKYGIYMLYISTDYVFDGRRGYYKETDEINPINVYGFTKYVGELWVDAVGRTSVIYGAKPASGKVNFALWLINKLGSGEEVRIIDDQYITPTLNTNLAKMSLEMVERGIKGVYHLAGETRVSRYDFTVKLAEVFGFDKELIKRSKMAEMNWKAERPKDSSLNTEKVSGVLNEKPYDLMKSLKVLKKEVYSDG